MYVHRSMCICMLFCCCLQLSLDVAGNCEAHVSQAEQAAVSAIPQPRNRPAGQRCLPRGWRRRRRRRRRNQISNGSVIVATRRVN
ncbi:hypothetical protein F5Y15DRAFT_147656 [Xylariaceae sp. FL0016]|nr:hypothetical protein F5Y15DRAFT_147656 [Xylariaceae sp. FL0016]